MSEPVPTDPREAALKATIEQPEIIEVYGRPRSRVPMLVSKIFGDGAKLVDLVPVDGMPDAYVVRVDGSWSLSNRDPEPTLGAHVDDILEAVADQFGVSDVEDDEGRELPDEDRAPWPALRQEIGVYWRARPWPAGFEPTTAAPAAQGATW